MTDITLCDTDQLPPELLLDDDHPTADAYIQNAQNVQRMIVATSALLKPSQTRAIKMAYKGVKNKDVAKELGVNAQTVANWLALPNAKKLLALLGYYQVTLDGPNEAQRRHMLWRIARANEGIEPKTSISALGELNKMTMTDYDRKNANTSNQPITIIINQDQLPRTALDG
jgi:DNA-binding transcriptional regulator YiaG